MKTSTSTKTNLLSVFCEKVPTSDPLGIMRGSRNYDVRIWADKEKTQQKAIFSWFQKSKPTHRNKYLTLNCFRWEIVWLN
jgi:hypothetical protein